MSQRIDSIRNHKALMKNGISYGSVIATELYDTSARGYMKHLAKCMLYEIRPELSGDGKKLFAYSLGYTGRKDYEEIRDRFRGFFPEFSYLDIDRKKNKSMFLPKGAMILGRWLKYLFSGVKTPFLCAILATEYMPLEKKLRNLVDFEKMELLVTFCDARCEDNILTQLAKQKKITTATLQHGQYRVLAEENEKADVEAYKNFISDKLLAWGEATTKEFVKGGIDKNRIVPVGALKSFSYAKKAPKHENRGVFGVVLCGETYESTNFEMIRMANELAKKYGLKYFLRCHPKNDVEKYMAKVEKEYLSECSSKVKNEEYVDKVDFSLIHMTGVFVELLGLNSVIFVYDDKYMEDLFKIEPYTFSETTKLFSLYESFAAEKETIETEQYKYYEYFNNGNALEQNYKNAVNALLKKESV